MNLQAKGGLSPLHVAVATGKLKNMYLLLEADADTSCAATTESGDTALHLAIASENWQMAHALVQHDNGHGGNRWDVLQKQNASGYTPLQLCHEIVTKAESEVQRGVRQRDTAVSKASRRVLELLRAGQ